MQSIKNLFSAHKYAIIGLILAVFLLMFLVGCEIKGRVITSEATSTQPAQYAKLSETEIAQVVAQMQQAFDQRAAAIKHDAAVATTLPAEQKAVAQADTQKAADILAADVDAFNSKITAALAEIAEKRQKANAVMDVLGGLAKIAVAGTFDPASLVGAGLSIGGTLLGIGAFADSKSKDKQIQALKATNPLKPDDSASSGAA